MNIGLYFGSFNPIHYGHLIIATQALNSSTLNEEPLLLEDSMVYFWRVVLVDNEMNWKTRSFQYIKNKRGWGQDVFGQFQSNSYIGISLNENNLLESSS